MGKIVDVTEVKSWADKTTLDDGLVNLIIDAAERSLDRFYVVPTIDATNPPPADLKLGVLMHCARLASRRTSPTGVIPGFETGAVRVARFDPDIEEMIGIPRKAACA